MATVTVAEPRLGFVQRHPLLTFLLIFNTFGQALAFAPVVFDLGVDTEWILSIATFAFLLAPALIITRVADGPDGLAALRRRMFRFAVPAHWYLLPLLVVPIGVVLLNGVTDIGPAYLRPFLPALAFQFLSTNWWEETVWTGFFQARLQQIYGPMRAVLITVPFFALQHVSLMVDGSVWAFLFLTVAVIPARALFGWVYNRTGSLALTGLVHAAANAAGFALIENLTGHTGDSSLTLIVLGLVVIIATRGRLSYKKEQS